MTGPTKGFLRRDRAAKDPRLPPGQYDTGADWPVLSAEPTPRGSTTPGLAGEATP